MLVVQDIEIVGVMLLLAVSAPTSECGSSLSRPITGWVVDFNAARDRMVIRALR